MDTTTNPLPITTSPLPEMVAQSPLKETLSTKPKTKEMNFYDALKEIMEGRKVTKLEWNDPKFYGVLDDTRLKLHKPDDLLYSWILTDGDIGGEDYIIV